MACTPARKKLVAAAEITALAAGAGPPANKMPTRSNRMSGRCGYDREFDTASCRSNEMNLIDLDFHLAHPTVQPVRLIAQGESGF